MKELEEIKMDRRKDLERPRIETLQNMAEIAEKMIGKAAVHRNE